MKIAFTSCMASTVFAQQPVWDQNAAQRPNRLLLLGDSIYIDAPPYPIGITHPQHMAPMAFLQHVLWRWRTQLDQPQFRALVRAVPTDAVWDAHDYLWDACDGGGAIHQRTVQEHIRISRALFNAFRRTLDARLAPSSFPSADDDAVINQPDEPPPGYCHRALALDMHLHLTDGRSWRLGRDLLGAAQRAQIEHQLAAAPAAVHLVASGSVVQADDGARWALFDDHAWLLALARQYKILVLSGDIHANRFKSIKVGDDRWLHDATASGAAVCKLIGVGSKCQNYGLLSTDPSTLRLDFFSHGTPDSVGAWAIDRNTWRASSAG